MTKWIALAVALMFVTSAYAMTPIPVHQPDGMVTQVRLACGPGRTRVNGVCVARTTIRHTRRVVRRCLRWNRGVCVRLPRHNRADEAPATRRGFFLPDVTTHPSI